MVKTVKRGTADGSTVSSEEICEIRLHSLKTQNISFPFAWNWSDLHGSEITGIMISRAAVLHFRLVVKQTAQHEEIQLHIVRVDFYEERVLSSNINVRAYSKIKVVI